MGRSETGSSAGSLSFSPASTVPLLANHHFSPLILPRFEDDITIKSGGDHIFNPIHTNKVIRESEFPSDRNYHVRIFRGIHLFDDAPLEEIIKEGTIKTIGGGERAGGELGMVHYIFIAQTEYKDFPFKQIKQELKLNDLVELYNNRDFLREE